MYVTFEVLLLEKIRRGSFAVRGVTFDKLRTRISPRQSQEFSNSDPVYANVMRSR